MEDRAALRACTVRTAGFRVRILEDLCLGERRFGTRDELEQGTFGWTLAKRLDAVPNLGGFSMRTAWEAETDFVEVMG